MLNQLETYSVLPARDLARARRFYRDVLGMEPDEERVEGLLYRTPKGAAIVVYETENGIATTSADRAAWFKDTEGNIICVSQTVAFGRSEAGSGRARRAPRSATDSPSPVPGRTSGRPGGGPASRPKTTYRGGMVKPRGWLEWEAEQARDWVYRPQAGDDKYSRGVLGVRTGSKDYPGAAVLGVDAAVRTGLGMVRYLGPRRAATLVLQRRPEIVTVPGRVQAWLLGSGINASTRTDAVTTALTEALAEGLPTVLDAGALDLVSRAIGPTVITPHAGELAAMLAHEAKPGSASQIAANPGEWAIRAARLFDVTVLLKGAVTHVASPSGARLTVSTGPAWLATAGSGDVLGGILGALLATHSDQLETDAASLAPLAATAALLHAEAAMLASAGGPIAALDIADAVPRAVAALLDHWADPGAR